MSRTRDCAWALDRSPARLKPERLFKNLLTVPVLILILLSWASSLQNARFSRAFSFPFLPSSRQMPQVNHFPLVLAFALVILLFVFSDRVVFPLVGGFACLLFAAFRSVRGRSEVVSDRMTRARSNFGLMDRELTPEGIKVHDTRLSSSPGLGPRNSQSARCTTPRY